MSTREPYADPQLARRFRQWVATEAPAAAPERIVFAVMDEVERSRPRRPALGSLRLAAGVAQYAALTAVIALGVAIGILATRNVTGPGDSVPPSPSSRASVGSTPSVVPSLSAAAAYPFDVTALTADAGSLWLATAGGDLVQLDAVTGAQRHRLALGFAATDIAISNGHAWAVAPGHDMVRVDLTTSALATVPDSAADRVAAGGPAVWAASENRLLGIDPGTLTISHDLAVPGHRALDPVTIAGSEVWVATNAAVLRYDTVSAAQAGSIPGDATDLLEAGGIVWATRGTELVRIVPETNATAFIGGMRDGALLGSDGVVLWLAGSVGGGPGELVAIDVASGAILSRTSIQGEVIGVAGTAGVAWVATSDDQRLRRYLVGP